jgi:hypothetical protein
MKTFTKTAIAAATACLLLGPASRVANGAGAERTGSESGEAHGILPDGGYLSFAVEKLTTAGGTQSVLTIGLFSPTGMSRYAYCVIPADAFSIASSGAALLSVALPGPGVECSSLDPGPMTLDVRFTPVPGESEDGHTGGEYVTDGVRYRFQDRRSRWDTTLSGMVGAFTVSALQGTTSTREELRVRID